jgi:hypothetical protein
MQMKPCARVIQRFARRIPRDVDSVASVEAGANSLLFDLKCPDKGLTTGNFAIAMRRLLYDFAEKGR